MPKNLDALAEKAASHFLHEERLLQLTDFPQAGQHQREHARLLKRICEVRLGFRSQGPGALTKCGLDELCGMFEQHIKDSDKAFSAYLNLRGIR